MPGPGSGLASRRGSKAWLGPQNADFLGLLVHFATQRKLPGTLEMLICAPIKQDLSPRWARGFRDRENQEISMLNNIARWGHNVLLAGAGLLTVVTFLYLAR